MRSCGSGQMIRARLCFDVTLTTCRTFVPRRTERASLMRTMSSSKFLKTLYLPGVVHLMTGSGEISKITSALIAGAGPILLEVGTGTPSTFIRLASGFLAVLVQPWIETQVDRIVLPI